nr:HC-Pro protein [Oat necrotic mottle virus]
SDKWVNAHIPRNHDHCNEALKDTVEGTPDKMRQVLKTMFDMHDLRCSLCRLEWRNRSHDEHQELLYPQVTDYMNKNPKNKLTLFRTFADYMVGKEQPDERQLRPNEGLQLVDVWRTIKQTIHIPNRIVYMGMFTDSYGNFDFFPNTSMPELFPRFMKPVTHRLKENGNIVTSFRYVDAEEIIQTSIESLYPHFESTYWNAQARAVHRAQPLHECSMEINGETKVVCHWEGNTPLYNPIIRATPGQLPFGVVNHLLSIGDRNGRHQYVPENGYCYMYIFACAMIFCGNSNRSTVDRFVNQVCNDLGPWPKFSEVLRQLNWMATFYGCYDALVPVILVDHINKTMHVPTPYGIKQSGMHTIRVNTVLELISLDTMADGAMKDYKIG